MNNDIKSTNTRLYLWWTLLVFLLFLLALFTQLCRQAWTDEFGGHPDEPAHYVTGLMIRDYIAAGIPEHPMRFAERYYAHYPKVALGHWPPLFYALMAPWMLLLTPSRFPLMLFMGLNSALTAGLILTVGIRLLGRRQAVLAALLFLGLPLTRLYGGMLMSDMLNAGLCFAATTAFGLFLDTARRRYVLAFALLSAAAIMTKGSAWLLAFVPLLSIAFTRRWNLIRQPALWGSAALVAVLCIPWYWLTLPMMHDGFENPQGIASSILALKFYALGLWVIFGPLLLLLGIYGAVNGVHDAPVSATTDMATASRRGLWASMVALAVAVPVFHCLVTNAYDTRYLLPALPPLVIMIMGGASQLYSSYQERWGRRVAFLLVAVVVGSVAIARTIPPGRVSGGNGFGMAASDLVAETVAGEQGNAWLISSDARGEGMFITQVAMRDENRPSFSVVRASKALADSFWDGQHYQPRFTNHAALCDFLLSSSFRFIIVDSTIPDSHHQSHHALLAETLAKYPEYFKIHNTYPITRTGVFYPAGLTIYK